MCRTKTRRTAEYGLKTWHSPDEPTVDICFIHGLTGHRDKTWTAAAARGPWPRHLLVNKFPQARLLTFGYDADVVRGGVAAKDTIKSLADNLLYSLRDDREEVGAAQRPLVFIVHSLGGIVCKKAVARSQHSPDETLARVAASLIGILFMGTPHEGSSLADASKLLVASLGRFKSTNKALLKVLQRDNQMAADIDNEFWEACKVIAKKSKEEIQIFCFFEVLPLPVLKQCVVPERSAVYQQHQSQKIDADHHNMVKFQSEDDPGFKHLCGVLRRFLSSGRAGLLFSPRGGASSGGAPPPPSRWLPQDPPQNAPSHDPPCDSSSGPGSQSHALTSSAPSRPKDGRSPPKRCYHLPFHRNPNFVGREDELQKLRVALFEEAHPAVALCGLSGVGKTQVANALVHWVKEHSNRSIYWVPAISKPSFEEAYAAIGAKLGLQRNRASQSQDFLTLVRDYLSSDAAGAWFLVLDNADDPELFCGSGVPDHLAKYLPKSGHGRTLVTTRTQKVAQTLAPKILPLDTLNIQQANDLAEALIQDKALLDDVSSADELFQKLGCLPLALSLAVAYMDQADVPAKEYLQLLHGTVKDKANFPGTGFPDSTWYREPRHAVMATWLVSFKHLQREHPDSVALLEFMSATNPVAIPIELLPKPGSGSEAARLDAVAILCAYSFVSMQKNKLSMHYLVHEATRSWLGKKGRLETVQKEAETEFDTWYKSHILGRTPPSQEPAIRNSAQGVLMFEPASEFEVGGLWGTDLSWLMQNTWKECTITSTKTMKIKMKRVASVERVASVDKALPEDGPIRLSFESYFPGERREKWKGQVAGGNTSE